ncbi:carbohydrate-binding domain-containing protein [Dactylosporangium sp. NPDC048998]|uniref:carbohydrate-binding domain-containing protein n=1 Tax=Dactylosporangium sp. NPDC048998 TaxID=3363976 RepID=UPI00371E5F32
MIDGPADYTGRRRTGTRRQPRIAFAAVLIVVAAVVLALRALPARAPGHTEVDLVDGPVVPALSAPSGQPTRPSGSPQASGGASGSASESARPAASGTPSAPPSPVPTTATATPTGGPASPSAGAGGTTSGALTIEAEAAGNGRPGQMTVREVAAASGGRAVTGVGNGRYLSFVGVDVAQPGDYRVTIAYLSADDRRCSIGTGRRRTQVSFPASGGLGSVATVTVTVQLQAGRNTVEAGNTPGRWCPDLDRITVAPADHPSTATS